VFAKILFENYIRLKFHDLTSSDKISGVPCLYKNMESSGSNTGVSMPLSSLAECQLNSQKLSSSYFFTLYQGVCQLRGAGANSLVSSTDRFAGNKYCDGEQYIYWVLTRN
jgi:hypothetical protein